MLHFNYPVLARAGATINRQKPLCSFIGLREVLSEVFGGSRASDQLSIIKINMKPSIPQTLWDIVNVR